MANPQAENGHIDIANEIVEALAKTRLSGEEMQILWIILRKTYGWHKKQDSIPLSQFSEMTGISKRQHVLRAVKKLLLKNIISVTKKGYSTITKNGYSQTNIYEFNKDFDKWVVLPKKVTVTKNGYRVLPKKVTRVLPKKGHSKETTKETIQKKDTYGDQFGKVKLTESEYQKLITSFGEQGTKDRIDGMDIYLESKGDKYKSHYATLLSWERKNNNGDGSSTNKAQLYADKPWMKIWDEPILRGEE